jgi:hypothetical protein
MKIHQLPVGQQLSIHGTLAEQPSNFDPLFKSPYFVEDTERSAVYTLSCQKKKLQLNIFMDTYSEELAISNIFRRSSRLTKHKVKIQYSEIIRSELQRSGRRVVR